MDNKFKNWIISVLRKASYKWRPRSEALKEAKVGQDGRAFLYKCAICEGIFIRKEVQIDHIDPVVPLDGYKSGMEFDWNEYIDRMFCEKDNFQIICKECHSCKSFLEKELRKEQKNQENA